jgi:hypothetical protein
MMRGRDSREGPRAGRCNAGAYAVKGLLALVGGVLFLGTISAVVVGWSISPGQLTCREALIAAMLVGKGGTDVTFIASIGDVVRQNGVGV